TEEEVEEMAKSEESEESSEQSEVLAKHEELVKENEELKKSVSKLVTLLTEKVQKSSAPKQKAITAIEYMKKSEEEEQVATPEKDLSKLSKSEAIARLREKARSNDLTKADRERINAYTFNEISI